MGGLLSNTRLRRAAKFERRFWRGVGRLAPLLPVLGVCVVVYAYVVGNLLFVNSAISSVSVEGYLSDHGLCPAGTVLGADDAIRFLSNRFLWLVLMTMNVLANLVCLVVSLYLIWQSLSGKGLVGSVVRNYPRRRGVLTVVGVLLAVCGPPLLLAFFSSPRRLMPQMAEIMECTAVADLPPATEAVFVANLLAISATFSLAAASCAILWPPRRGRQKAQELARRMGYLRVLLYVGTLSLVVGVLRMSATLHWSLSHLPPASEKDPAGSAVTRTLEGLVSSMTTAQALSNTLILAAVYIPAFLILRHRAAALANRTMHPPKREEWLKARGLSVSFSEYLPRIAAILGPLLAGPIGDLIGRLSK